MWTVTALTLSSGASLVHPIVVAQAILELVVYQSFSAEIDRRALPHLVQQEIPPLLPPLPLSAVLGRLTPEEENLLWCRCAGR